MTNQPGNGGDQPAFEAVTRLAIAPRLAVDAHGYVWRVWPDLWSMAPNNPDNEPIPEPITYYEQVSVTRERIATAARRIENLEDRLVRAYWAALDHTGQITPGMTLGEVAALVPDDLSEAFWRRSQLNDMASRAGGWMMWRASCADCGWNRQAADEPWVRNSARVHAEMLKPGHRVTVEMRA